MDVFILVHCSEGTKRSTAIVQPSAISRLEHNMPVVEISPEEKERKRLELSVQRFLEETKEEDEGTEFVLQATQAAQQSEPQAEGMQEEAEEQPTKGLMSRSE